MLYVLHQNAYTEEEASVATGLPLIKYKKDLFLYKTESVDLNKDDFFRMCVKEIDLCDIPMRNVVRDLATGETHSFDKVSGGVMALWLMYNYYDAYMMPTCYFGENCYQIVLDISKDRDIYVYDDADMLNSIEFEKCKGTITDFKTKKVATCENEQVLNLTLEEGY